MKPYKFYRRNNPMIVKGFYKTLAKEYDKYGFMSEELGKELESLFDDDYVVGIHRTGYTMVTPEFLNDVFNNGLINNGDGMQGIVQYEPDITKTVSLQNNFLLMYGQIKTCNKYKNSQGVIITKIPKSYLMLKEGEVKPIYFPENDYSFRLLPEYIYGYVSVDKGVCTSIVRNPNYRDFHNYNDEGLVFDSNVYDLSSKSKSK